MRVYVILIHNNETNDTRIIEITDNKKYAEEVVFRNNLQSVKDPFTFYIEIWDVT